MKVAFVGKGGSGKTTLSALFCRYLASLHAPIIAIDADINQHLGDALGLSKDELAYMPPLGLEMERIKEYLRGTNPRIASASAMTKTTPPGRGSRLWYVRENNSLLTYFGHTIDGMTVLATGPFSEDDLGLKCYHSKVGAVELLLNHCIDGADEYVVVDMTAGADSFASGLFTQFDVTFLVVEPTKKSLDVYQQYKEYARNYTVQLKVIGNKIETEDDLVFLREQVGEDLLTWLWHSDYVHMMERGGILPFSQLETGNLVALEMMKHTLDYCQQNWELFYRQAVEFHRKNALSWMNNVIGEDVADQIDPDFSLMASVHQQKQSDLLLHS